MTVEEKDGKFVGTVGERPVTSLPAGDVLIRVYWSSLNYKDALSASGNRGVTRTYPHTPGIDAAGMVESSSDERFHKGDEVVVTGYDLGMNTDGGFAEYVRVPAGWVVPLPEGLTLKEAMIYGTAGFTAGLSVKKLVDYGIRPEDGPVLVTGSTGGVGSVAVSILHTLGYTVTAVTGKPDAAEMLHHIGASAIVSHEDVTDTTGKALLKTKWAAVVDTVGGPILETALRTVRYGGCVTSCGNAAGFKLSVTVYPFILRGVALLGVDSVECPMDKRLALWKLLAGEWKPATLHDNVHEITLDELNDNIALILKGKLKGRTIVNLQK